MKIKINKITIHSFKNFQELTYKIGSGRLYGSSGVGKTNILTAIAACFVNSGMDGKKICPLPDDSNSGWVKIDYTLDGESFEAYRTWARTDTGFTSSSSLTKALQKSLFLAIANPLYIFELDTADRTDLLVDWKYFDYVGDLSSELTGDVSIEVTDFLKKFSPISLAKLRNLTKNTKQDLKSLVKEKEMIDSQLLILEEVEDSFELVTRLTARANSLNVEIKSMQDSLRIISTINSILLKNAVDEINKSLCLTRFSEEGKITFGGFPSDRLSSGERLDCGLDIANVIASKNLMVPPTLIDDITSMGHHDIDIQTFENLSQIISTSYANVDLCEYNGNALHGLDKSWKNKVSSNFRPEVVIEMMPYS